MENNKRITILWLLAICGVIFHPCPTGAMHNVGQSEMQFLKITPSARAAAMGDAFVSMDMDVGAVFFNPAGLASIPTVDIMLARNQWIAGIVQNGVVVGMNLGDYGTLAMSFLGMDYGIFHKTEVRSDYEIYEKGYEEVGTFEVGEYAVSLAYARRMTDKFALGGQMRYARQDFPQSMAFDELGENPQLVSNVSKSTAWDFGTIYYPGWFRTLRFCMSMRNFSNGVLPLTFSLSSAMDAAELVHIDTDRHSLLVAVDALHPRDYGERIHLGFEYCFRQRAALRAGYKFNYDEENLTFGAGLVQPLGSIQLKLDYAVTRFGIFGMVQRINMDLSLIR